MPGENPTSSIAHSRLAGAIVVHGQLAIDEPLQGGVALHAELLGQVGLNGGIDLRAEEVISCRQVVLKKEKYSRQARDRGPHETRGEPRTPRPRTLAMATSGLEAFRAVAALA